MRDQFWVVIVHFLLALLMPKYKSLNNLKTMAGAIAHRLNNSMQVKLSNLEFLQLLLGGDKHINFFSGEKPDF